MRIADHVLHPRLLRADWAPASRTLWIKPESLQRTGSCKVRGAVNAVLGLSEPELLRGVVTYSSGNHGHAVALAAQLAGTSATVVVPDDAPAVKIDAIGALGARAASVPRADLRQVAESLRDEEGLVLVPPSDDRAVIAGQGTIGLEIADEIPDLAAVLVPVSGGGLLAGVAAAVKALQPNASVIGVEPILAADTAQSLREGRRVEWSHAATGRTIADALRAPTTAPATWPHIERLVDGVITVTEEEILRAVGTLATRDRLVAEPSGAVSTAAFLFHRDEIPPGNTVAVLSGGNVDGSLLANALVLCQPYLGSSGDQVSITKSNFAV
nr:threonine/serine dehydratase [Lentzea sp. NBRC 105346]